MIRFSTDFSQVTKDGYKTSGAKVSFNLLDLALTCGQLFVFG
jgi:hypothetical protein